ncbi:MAG: hypothetical protein ACHQNT_11515 [Bacteroidia bacterium]
MNMIIRVMQILFLFALINLNSCCKKTNAPVKTNDSPVGLNKLTEATVIDYSEIAGCTFLLQLNNGEKLEPSNLSSEFKKDKLKVLIKYQITDMQSACMAGKVVSVSHIELKK